MKVTTSIILLGITLLSSPLIQAEESLNLDKLFPQDRVLSVEIKVSDENWNKIRYQAQNFFTALGAGRKVGKFNKPYTFVEASVKIDGVEFPKVAIRKKGFIGSQSPTHPSLKVKLDFYDPEGGIEGLKVLTLNNNKQDYGLVSQYMSYQIFNEAGSPAPRSAFAHVKVNGKDLGIYTHVESYKKPLLQRAFKNKKGVLYEGTVTDFFPEWEKSFELKFGDEELGSKVIQELTSAIHPEVGKIFLGDKDEARLFVPIDGSLQTKWIQPDFDDSEWIEGKGGAGYDNERGYQSHIHKNFDVKDVLYRKGTSIYLRYKFDVEDLSEIQGLSLGMKFDDGFVAYLNGHRIASANAPKDLSWQSKAIGSNDDRGATRFQSFLISQHKEHLRKGRNVLAIHGLNVDASSSDMLMEPQLNSMKDTFKEGLAKTVNLDAFYRFWVIESVLGFWDGYSGNRNNYFFYIHPEEKKLHFMPWGADSLFQKIGMVDRNPNLPVSVKTLGVVSYRLYQTEEGKKRYLKELRSFLKNHWNEKKLLAETDRLEALLKPYTEKVSRQRHFNIGLNAIRDFIKQRRSDIEEEIKDGMPNWTRAPSEPPIIGGRRFNFDRDDDDEDEEEDDNDNDGDDSDDETDSDDDDS